MIRSKGLPILLSTIWITISEFVRNELLGKSLWTEHYESLGLVFPSEPLNGIVWLIWSFVFAVIIYVISRRFNLVQTTFISWTMAFVMMWLVVGNLSVLPFAILYMAVPLSILEALLATWIIVKMAPPQE